MTRPTIRMPGDDPGVRSRAEFGEFVALLRRELRNDPERWENRTLESYLEALAAVAEDSPGWTANGVRDDVETPSWSLFSDLLSTAAVYE